MFLTSTGLLLHHDSCSLRPALSLGRPLSEHLRLQDLEVSALFRLQSRHRHIYSAKLFRLDQEILNIRVTVNSFFLLLSFRNFSLFLFPLRARSNSWSALETEQKDTQCCRTWNVPGSPLVMVWFHSPRLCFLSCWV